MDAMMDSNELLTKIDNANVMVLERSRQEKEKDKKVALICGGGSGHEPAHAGFIGVGMLDAAVIGDVFTSPSPSQVLAAIRAVTGAPGCLLIVMNYTGDRLNFGIAAEMARNDGLRVEMLVVGDDVATIHSSKRRGIAGTVLVNKILGSYAQRGMALDQLIGKAHQLLPTLNSMGVSLSSCTVPAVGRPNFELGDDELEFGLGIHGEPGIKREKLTGCHNVVRHIVEYILENAPNASQHYGVGKRLVVMVNNLGSTTQMEMNVVVGETVRLLQSKGYIIDRLINGTLMTALDMSGISISIMSSDNDIIECIDYPTNAQGWPVNSVSKPRAYHGQGLIPLGKNKTQHNELPDPNQHIYDKYKQVVVDKSTAMMIKSILEHVCKALQENSNILTDLDSKVGDGDLGITLERCANNVLKLVDIIPFDRPCYALLKISHILQETAGGSSGPFYAVFFMKLATSIFQSHQGKAPNEPITRQQWAYALREGYLAIQQLGGAKIGDCTMLDALIPAIDTIVRMSNDTQLNIKQILEASAEAAHQGAQSTVGMRANQGRASYLGDRSKDCMDPGACAISVIFQSIKLVPQDQTHHHHDPDTSITFYPRFMPDILSGAKTITIRDFDEAKHIPTNYPLRVYPHGQPADGKPICRIQVESILSVRFDQLNEHHAKQENMTLDELKRVISEIYPNENKLYVVTFHLV
ncbi:hypothetical protein SAMD00019534_054620 [Acytostelium subglobosum LB1]|uniref:hypothetical protein n=1 Tax=Acytostelium subglobosum LB1 TaxID=1410327 RepID=UPI000644A847|nr:hypothetical protein SAMD00019534_054620 [Acytostelium subglobosum LB1]GAM22287.1 hypothetical protein SAMD00019534_054620 [Acytostelium subglobosum LB1]|eukprot:XP_012754407.1 hypothetical protein SAMD00019534_054620 [Acytostelium subglobosum LB1]